ncbi:MAG: metallophosphoesterase, partial [Clostridiales bacterium]|nr:metallophosphoesterase [Clostridiales bacterium]
MRECRFFVVTDTHYFAKSLEAFGAEYDDRMDGEQKCFAETESINRAVFDFLSERDEADIVLIAGDLSYDGEKESHREFSRLLHEFSEKSGKKIFVVTAGHDCNKTPHAYNDAGRYDIEGTSFGELYDFYRDFGYDDAIEFNRERMSYVVDLTEDVRLLVICNDTAEERHVTYSDDFIKWIEVQAKKAQADGKMMIAMEHYPVLPGQPIFALIRDAYQKENERLIETLADNGVHLIFTGHMHNQSINVTSTKKGNVFYDVCTGCTIGCPAYIRLVTVRDKQTVEIKSFPIPEFDWDKNGKTGEEYLRAQFEKMIRTLIDAMQNDR